MLKVQKSDLSYGDGTKTGLPKPLVGGTALNTPEIPVCASGRACSPDTLVTLSYALARGCVKLLAGDMTGVELIGRKSETIPVGVHLVLSNGTSHAWAVMEDSSTGKSLLLRGVPFSSQLVNYNAGIAIGLFLLLNHESYPDFASAALKAVDAGVDKEGPHFTGALALMADELAFAIEQMIDGDGPMNIQALLMDREAPADLDAVFDGGGDLKLAFQSRDALAALLSPGIPAPVVLLPQTETMRPKMTFLGDLPEKLTDCIRRGKHALLTGPTATGKTLCVEEVCLQIGAPITVIRGSEGLEDRDLIGSTVIEAERAQGGQFASKTRFTYGPVPEALMLGKRQYELHLREVERAAADGRAPRLIPPSVLLVDEVNRLQLRFQNFLLSAMNVRKASADYYLRIPDTNEEITCPDGFFVIIAARNVGGVFAGTNPMDIALERRFYKKIDIGYLPAETEEELLQSRTGLGSDLSKVLVKVASDTRFQLSQLRSPLDTGTLLSWAEELSYLKGTGRDVTDKVILDAARDVIFGIVLGRTERGAFDPAGEAILTDNVRESYRNVFKT